ncbi:hypothetical protein F4782DRAFT_521720 [Xylaria castorea]|nr:hypothetical protein F4782DRAFT_521720 [Xylaria castorea]
MMLFSKYLTRHIEFWLLSLLALVTLGLQFSSTILLSDIANFVILGDVGRVSLPDLLNINDEEFEIDVPIGSFITQKLIYGSIDEVNTDFNTSPDVRGLSQTGLVQRAFLPLSEAASRTPTRHFSGNAIVMSSNTACIRPEISDVSVSTTSTYCTCTGFFFFFLVSPSVHVRPRAVSKDIYVEGKNKNEFHQPKCNKS